MTNPTCSTCGCELTDDTGWGFTTTLAEGSAYTWFCGDHHPNKGKGYTLADLEQWRQETQIARDMRQVDLMNMLGPDVYFFVKAGEELEAWREKLRRQQNTLADMVDTLKRIGVITDDEGTP